MPPVLRYLLILRPSFVEGKVQLVGLLVLDYLVGMQLLLNAE